MLLPANQVGALQPADELVVDIGDLAQAEGVQDVLPREHLDTPESRTGQTYGENDVAVEPSFPWNESGEAHPGVQSDS
jgi:hypothetical protein